MKVIRSRRKTLAIQIKNGELIVRAPIFTLTSTIEKFVQKHQDWIEKKLSQSQIRPALSSEQEKDLQKKARLYIPNRVSKLASEHWKHYNAIRITSAKTRWWSCSGKKNLNFSYRLMLLPKDVIDYVIIHELAHLKYMNHSKQFWNHVESMMSDYQEKEKWLKHNSARIA